MEIVEVNSPRQLDQLVAEKLLGWSDFWEGKGYLMGYPPEERETGLEAERVEVPHFCSDISHAWMLVEHLRQEGWFVALKTKPDSEAFTSNEGDIAISTCCVCELYRPAGPLPKRLFAFHDAPGAAICIAALKTKDVDAKYLDLVVSDFSIEEPGILAAGALADAGLLKQREGSHEAS